MIWELFVSGFLLGGVFGWSVGSSRRERRR